MALPTGRSLNGLAWATTSPRARPAGPPHPRLRPRSRALRSRDGRLRPDRFVGLRCPIGRISSAPTTAGCCLQPCRSLLLLIADIIGRVDRRPAELEVGVVIGIHRRSGLRRHRTPARLATTVTLWRCASGGRMALPPSHRARPARRWRSRDLRRVASWPSSRMVGTSSLPGRRARLVLRMAPTPSDFIVLLCGCRGCDGPAGRARLRRRRGCVPERSATPWRRPTSSASGRGGAATVGASSGASDGCSRPRALVGALIAAAVSLARLPRGSDGIG